MSLEELVAFLKARTSQGMDSFRQEVQAGPNWGPQLEDMLSFMKDRQRQEQYVRLQHALMEQSRNPLFRPSAARAIDPYVDPILKHLSGEGQQPMMPPAQPYNPLQNSVNGNIVPNPYPSQIVPGNGVRG